MMEGVVGIAEETLCVVDTLLLRAFVLCNALASASAVSTEMRALLAQTMQHKMAFLRGKNWCVVDDCERLLLMYVCLHCLHWSFSSALTPLLTD